jgi:hypothetical protein
VREIWFLAKPWSGVPPDSATHSLQKSAKESLPNHADENDLARSDLQRGDAFRVVIGAHNLVADSARHAPVTNLRLNPQKEINFQLATTNTLHG